MLVGDEGGMEEGGAAGRQGKLGGRNELQLKADFTIKMTLTMGPIGDTLL